MQSYLRQYHTVSVSLEEFSDSFKINRFQLLCKSIEIFFLHTSLYIMSFNQDIYRLRRLRLPLILPFITSCNDLYLLFRSIWPKYDVFLLLIVFKSSLSLTILCDTTSIIWSIHGIFRSLLRSHILKVSSFLIRATLTV